MKMTPSMLKRLTLVHIWRMMRSWRILQLVGIFIFISVNIILLTRSQSDCVKDGCEHEDFGIKNSRAEGFGPSASIAQEFSVHPKLSLPRFLKEGYHAVSPQPQVKEQLSSGVREEENSAREVLDGDLSDKDTKHVHVEDNAANEVNSIEPQLNVDLMEFLGPTTDDDTERGLSPDFHNWRNLTQVEINRLSVLGRRLYLQENIGQVQDRNFTILFWKTGKNVERRFMKQFGKVNVDPFQSCSVKNCKISYEDSLASTADAILIHLHRTKGPDSFPHRTNFNQRWIWLSDETPYNTFMVAKDKNIAHYNGYFNWSMTYRMDSDIPVPYGRTVEMTDSEASLYQNLDYFTAKSKTVAVMGSNCGGNNKRWDYVKQLQKFINVDVYGKCGNLTCPGHFSKDCKSLNDYKFYLSFENGNCQEYITEKVWWNALGKGVVPVVMGGRIEDYRKILPPDSFIHVDEFRSPHLLAKHLISVSYSRTKYMRYHAWRSRFRVTNEHGYFGSEVFHYCRICEALNYNDPAPTVKYKMEDYWNKETQCYSPTWQSRMLEKEV